MDVEPAGGLGHNNPPEPTLEERLAGIDPTNLLVIKLDDMPALFAAQYPGLVDRSAEFVAGVARWREAHDEGRKPIANDEENAALSDWMRQMADFAGTTGEVEEARKAVKRSIFEAGKIIDAWFRGLADPIIAAVGPSRGAPIGTLQYAQTAYLLAKEARERAERERLAAEAQAEADRQAKIARDLAEQEAARAAALAEKGIDHDTAQEVAERQTDRAYSDASIAMDTAHAAAAATTVPAQDLVRQRSQLGTTTSLQKTWEAEVTDMRALARAVADGTAPVTFITANLSTINNAARQKVAPMRECPGIVYRQVPAARRTGR